MKKLFLILFVLVPLTIFYSCNKENGKHKYLLTLNFEGYSESTSFECYAFEKMRNYDEDWAPTKLEMLNSNYETFVCNADGMKLMLNTNRNKSGQFDGQGHLEFTDNTFPIDVQPYSESNRFVGGVSLSGSFSRNGKELNMSGVTFNFNWSNHSDYGYPPTALTGSLSIKRM